MVKNTFDPPRRQPIVLTRERLIQIANVDKWVRCTHEEAQEMALRLIAAEEELQEHRKAVAEQEPVAPELILQQEKTTCMRCGRTTTHPEGWHYCHGGRNVK